jgi:hypothetical protein
MTESPYGDLVYESDSGLQVHEMLRNPGEDKPLPPGHFYQVGWLDKNGDWQGDIIRFQDGPIPANGVNGLTSEALLAIIIHRTSTLNGQFPCDENENAIKHMERALALFNERTAKRKARGVEGQLKA